MPPPFAQLNPHTGVQDFASAGGDWAVAPAPGLLGRPWRPAPCAAGCRGSAWALACASLLAGCAGPPAGSAGALSALQPYVAPAVGQPAARLLLRAAVPAGDRFAVIRHQDAERCLRPQVVTEGGPPQAAPVASLAAGTLTTLDFVVLRAGQPGCGVSLSFTPVAGRSYLVQGLVVGAGCDAQLVDATQPDRPQPVADLVRRSAAGQRCLPLAQARAQAQAGTSGSAIQGGQVNGEAVLDPRATAADLEGLIRP